MQGPGESAKPNQAGGSDNQDGFWKRLKTTFLGDKKMDRLDDCSNRLLLLSDSERVCVCMCVCLCVCVCVCVYVSGGEHTCTSLFVCL